METTQAKPQTQDKQQQIVLGAFGNGRYSPAMHELFNDSQRLLGFTPEQAHVTATRLGIDAGQLLNSKVTLAFGRTTNKDGHRTLKEITKAVRVPNSWAMSIGTICAQLDETRKQGLVVNDCTVAPELMKFVNEATERLQAKKSE